MRLVLFEAAVQYAMAVVYSSCWGKFNPGVFSCKTISLMDQPRSLMMWTGQEQVRACAIAKVRHLAENVCILC